MPIAVMIESSENTMSMMVISNITLKKAALPEAAAVRLMRFDLAMDFVGRLGDQKQPAGDQDDVAP